MKFFKVTDRWKSGTFKQEKSACYSSDVLKTQESNAFFLSQKAKSFDEIIFNIGLRIFKNLHASNL